MTFVRRTDGSYINLDRITTIGPPTPGPYDRPQHALFDAAGTAGYAEGWSLGMVLLDLVPAGSGWRVLRATQDEDGEWGIASSVPVIAFGRSLEGLWQPLPSDFILDHQIANPTALKHDSEDVVYDSAHGETFEDVAAWLADLGDDSEEPIP